MCSGGLVPSYHRLSPHPRLITSSNTISERKPRQASRQAEAWRPQRSYPSGQTEDKQASKTRTTDDLTPFHIIPRPHDDHTGFISYRHQHNRPVSRQARRDARTRRRRDARRRDNKTTGTASKNETTERRTTRRRNETPHETHDDKSKSKQASRGTTIGRREEHNTPFSNLSPDPLPPSLSNPPASIIPPPPGRGMSGRVSKLARHRRPSVARRPTSRTPSSHPPSSPMPVSPRRISSSPSSSLPTRRFR